MKNSNSGRTVTEIWPGESGTTAKSLDELSLSGGNHQVNVIGGSGTWTLKVKTPGATAFQDVVDGAGLVLGEAHYVTGVITDIEISGVTGTYSIHYSGFNA